MTISTNYFTKLIKKIRADLVVSHVVDGLPVPTDEEVQTEMDRVFRTMENRTFGNSVLRRSVDSAGNNLWFIGNILFSSTIPQTVMPSFGSSHVALTDGSLTLSSELPETYVSANIETLAGNLALSYESPEMSIV